MLDKEAMPVATYGPTDAENVAALLNQLRAADGPRRDTFRQLQPHIVDLPKHVAQRPDVAALLSPVVGDLLEWRGDYDPFVGIDEDAIATSSIY
jgi:CRISPR-associated endonuclease/helicase Cas3